MIYDVIKALHIISVIVWVAGMVSAAVFLRSPSRPALPVVTGFDRRVTTPAMILAFAFGIALAVMGGWFTTAWLGAKIVVVLVLAGLHGMITGRLRRMLRTNDDGGALPPDDAVRVVLPLGLIALIVTVGLVTTKAF